MTKQISRFESAMNQLDDAFQNAKAQQQLKKTTNKAQTPVGAPRVDFEQSLQDGIEKLERLKQKQPSQSSDATALIKQQEVNQQEVKQQESLDLAPTLDQNALKSKAENLLEHLVQNTLNQAVIGVLNKNLVKTNELAEQTLFTTTHKVKKNSTHLLEKFSQYADIKMNFYVELGETKVKMKDLFNLKEGDLLPTNRALEDFLTFYINQKPIGKGKLKSVNASRGFQIYSFYQKL